MVETFFEDISNPTEGTKCKCVKVAAQIRRNAIQKSASSYRRQSEDNHGPRTPRHSVGEPSEDLIIPTDAGLRTTLTLDVVRDLLSCRCEFLCKPQLARFDAAEDEDLAHYIYGQLQTSDAKLRTVAILVLSGTLFALRTYHHSHFYTLDEFIGEVQAENDRHLRVESERGRIRHQLLSGLVPNNELRNRDALTRVTHLFVESVKASSWLWKIQDFNITPQLKLLEFDKWKINLPFVDELPTAPETEGRTYFRFRLAEEYATGNLKKIPVLFRKVHTYQTDDQTWKQRAKDEVAMLRVIHRLDSENIAKMLFSFEERHEWGSRLSIVFQYYELNLLHVLSPGFRGLNVALENVRIGEESVLRHPLWKAMQGIVGAVEALHSPGSPEQGWDCIGHYDIKPEHVLVEKGEGGIIRLLLTDFDHAIVHRRAPDRSNSRARGPTTHDYAPPEMQMRSSDGSGAQREISYDTWSLGCVLLEVLVHLNSTDNGYQTFLRERRGGSSSTQDQAFWTRDDYGVYRLRDAVGARLNKLERTSHPGMKMTAQCIRRMLSTNPTERPSISQCMKDFRNISAPSRYDWVPNGARGIMTVRLPQMSTYCTAPQAIEETDCSIYIWHQETIDRRYRVLMAIERAPLDRWTETSDPSNECFVPVAFFNTEAIRDKDFKCAFKALFRDTVIRFQDAAEYLNFFTLFTSQRLLNCTIDVGFTGCEALIHKRFARDEPCEWTTGSVQIWNTYEEAKYKSQFTGDVPGVQYVTSAQLPNGVPISQSGGSDPELSRMPSPRTVRNKDGNPHVPDPRLSRFKLALFVYPIDAKNVEPICIVFRLDSDNIVLEPPVSGELSIRFSAAKKKKHDAFPVAIYRPSVAVRANLGQSDDSKLYPGIPCAPEQVNDDISNARDGLRLASLKINFRDLDERKRVINEIARLNIMER